MSKSHGMSAAATSWILSEGYAGLQAQALGLAEAAGLRPELRVLTPRAPWKWVKAGLWPAPLSAVPDAVRAPLPGLVIGCGGVAAAVGAALRAASRKVVQVQHPRMDPRRFDLVMVTRHDELTGPNIVVTRTALHRVTPARLADAARRWHGLFAHLKRPLVAVLLGGSNGRFRLDAEVARTLAGQIAAMMRCNGMGVAVTPSRRTDPEVTRVLAEALTPLGAYVWDGSGENPYFGMLALADAIIVTVDSVSMVSEAVATASPVMLAALPGKSRRNSIFVDGLRTEGRVREFTGKLELWPVKPLDDTAEAAAEMCRRLAIPHPETSC
jgi:mitochondrial fission protein ELM1